MPGFVDFLSAWTEVLKIARMFFFFVGSQFGSIVSSRDVQVCSLNVPILFIHRTFYCRFICFSNECNITSYVRLSSSVSFTAIIE